MTACWSDNATLVLPFGAVVAGGDGEENTKSVYIVNTNLVLKFAWMQKSFRAANLYPALPASPRGKIAGRIRVASAPPAISSQAVDKAHAEIALPRLFAPNRKQHQLPLAGRQ